MIEFYSNISMLPPFGLLFLLYFSITINIKLKEEERKKEEDLTMLMENFVSMFDIRFLA